MSGDAFFRLYADLPREGPGDRATLDRALALAQVRPDARILDAGCGSGADVGGLLAHAPQGRVTAIDTHAPFVARIRAAHEGDPRVGAEAADMAAPPGGPFELIWSAGAAYFLGVERALRTWRAHLAPGGKVAFSQLCWRVADPSRAARDFFDADYPAMTDAAGVRDQVARAGWLILGDFWLSRAAWDAYYAPLAARAAKLRAEPGMAEVCDQSLAEAALWRSHGGDYGYLQIVAQPG